MKATLSLGITAVMFFGTLGSMAMYAKPSSHSASRTPTEVIGCLEQGPAAKEYLLKASDGTTWGVNETDMLLNKYVDQTVTVSGDIAHPNASERSAGGAHHYLRAYGVVVDGSTCPK